ncbi:MAG: DUF4878 domain-containing protein [Bacilli bacterium]|nr:DUF4878 domain-containing protein [Bacilli bacterium]
MKKILVGLIMLILVTGCGGTLFNPKASPTRAVEDLFTKYQTLNQEVTNQLDEVVAEQNLTTAQKDQYKELMKRQYKDLTYTIKDEVINGDTAIVTVEIQVYDYARAQIEVDEHVEENPNDFLDDNEQFSNLKYMDYKIDTLMKENRKTKYTLDIRLTKEEDEWLLDELTETEKQKIHGVYITA